MFNGFQTTISPAVQVWDFSVAPANTLQNPASQISLTSDCAPVQIFYLGGTYNPVSVTLPTASTPGKIIRFRVEAMGSISLVGIGVNIYDTSYNYGSGTNLLASIGPPGEVALICVANQKMGSTAYSAYAWQVLQGPSPYGPTGAGSGSRQAVNLGGLNVATGLGSMAMGNNNTSSSTYTIALGSGTTASANYATALNGSNFATGGYSFIAGGYYGTTNGIDSKTVLSGNSLGTFGTSGASQTGFLCLAAQTTDATTTTLRSNTSAASTTNQLVLQNNSAQYVSGNIIANVTGAGNTSAWTFEAVIKRGANAASTVIVQSVINLAGQNSGASGWAVAVAADTTNGGLAVTVTGQAATTIRWVARLNSTEVSY